MKSFKNLTWEQVKESVNNNIIFSVDYDIKATLEEAYINLMEGLNWYAINFGKVKVVIFYKNIVRYEDTEDEEIIQLFDVDIE